MQPNQTPGQQIQRSRRPKAWALGRQARRILHKLYRRASDEVTELLAGLGPRQPGEWQTAPVPVAVNDRAGGYPRSPFYQSRRFPSEQLDFRHNKEQHD